MQFGLYHHLKEMPDTRVSIIFSIKFQLLIRFLNIYIAYTQLEIQ